MSLKTILDSVLGQSGFLQKSAYVGSGDPDDIQMVSIANRVADEIKDFYPWEALIKSHSVTFTETGSVTDTLYYLPTGFLSLVPDSAWSSSGSEKVDIPVNGSEWYELKNSSLSDGGTVRARIRMGMAAPQTSGSSVIVPKNMLEVVDPTVGESITFNYISDYPVISTSNVYKEYFTADNDTFILDEGLLTLGVQAHWMQTKMMPQYKEHMVNYLKKMNQKIGLNTSGQIVGGSPHRRRFGPYYPLWRS